MSSSRSSSSRAGETQGGSASEAQTHVLIPPPTLTANKRMYDKISVVEEFKRRISSRAISYPKNESKNLPGKKDFYKWVVNEFGEGVRPNLPCSRPWKGSALET